RTSRASTVAVEHISRAILVLRGHKVLLDTELAALYGVSAKRFNEQVRRNRDRFPADFIESSQGNPWLQSGEELRYCDPCRAYPYRRMAAQPNIGGLLAQAGP